MTEGNPLELVPAVQPDVGIFISDEYTNEYGNTAAIGVDIMNEVDIAENVGGGLHISLVSKLPWGNIQLKLKGIAVLQKFFVQGNFQCQSYTVLFEWPMKNPHGVYSSSESVEINKVFLFNLQVWDSWVCVDSYWTEIYYPNSLKK